nr:methionyl-tRNA formyltransferase [Bellilinea sp.]
MLKFPFMIEHRIVFMGSPEFAIPSLKALARYYQVVGVVTQPDRPSGRGRTLTPPPVKVVAQELGIETIQPNRLKEAGVWEKLVEWAPDVIVVAAFGQILRQNVLDLPRFGCINVHASLLPRWRGAAPIQAAILHGDKVSGVSIMKMDAGIDTGPVLSQRSIPIEADDDAASLGNKLAIAGSELLLETLPDYLRGEIIPQVQDESQATYAPMLKKEEGGLDFAQPAEYLERKIRAFFPWPGAYLVWEGNFLKVKRASVLQQSVLPQGKRSVVDGLPAVGTSEGVLLLREVQPAGKKWMNGEEFLRGARQWREV